MKTGMEATLDTQVNGDRPLYESPRVLSLAGLRAGVGQECETCCYPHGSGAYPYCAVGNNDGDACAAGSNADCCLPGNGWQTG